MEPGSERNLDLWSGVDRSSAHSARELSRELGTRFRIDDGRGQQSREEVGLQFLPDGPSFFSIGSIACGLTLPHRRLQDRIQALVAQAIATEDPRELEDVIRRLQEALREHAK